MAGARATGVWPRPRMIRQRRTHGYDEQTHRDEEIQAARSSQ